MQTATDNKRNLSGSSSVSCNSFASPSLLGCERPPDGGPLASCFSGDSRCVSSEAFFGPPSRIWQYEYVRLCVRTYVGTSCFYLLLNFMGNPLLKANFVHMPSSSPLPSVFSLSSPLLLGFCRGPSPYLRTYVGIFCTL